MITYVFKFRFPFVYIVCIPPAGSPSDNLSTGRKRETEKDWSRWKEEAPETPGEGVSELKQPRENAVPARALPRLQPWGGGDPCWPVLK